MTKITQQLHIIQQTLSHRIAQLKDKLGVRLFMCINYNMNLTEDGMIFKRCAQELLTLSEKTKQDFLYKNESLEGTNSIGSGGY